MPMPTVSIIIPVYDVEPYLHRCLDSVCGQSFTNLEIICVNDFSPDRCGDILDEFSKKDNRLHIINHDKNRGLSVARNSGLNVAHGNYICFIDSDDWVDSDYIEKMVASIEQNDVPVILNTNVFCHYEYTTELRKMTQPWKHQQKSAMLTGKVSISQMVNKHPMSCCYIYKNDFINTNNLKFPEGLRHEDQYFSHIILPYLDKLYVIYGPQYHYLKRENSITGIWDKKIDYYDLIDILAEIYNYYKKYKFLDEYPIPFDVVMAHLKRHSDPERFFKKMRLLFIEMKNDIITRQYLYDRNILTTIFYAVLSNSNAFEFLCDSKNSKRLLLDRLRSRVCQELPK
jgi:glycosyltransferase involved in cell wall biosynthesis